MMLIDQAKEINEVYEDLKNGEFCDCPKKEDPWVYSDGAAVIDHRDDCPGLLYVRAVMGLLD